jgi:hypothetical protein
MNDDVAGDIYVAFDPSGRDAQCSRVHWTAVRGCHLVMGPAWYMV